jgi:hypothetical protein
MSWMDDPAAHARAEASVSDVTLGAAGMEEAIDAEREKTARQLYQEMMKENRSWGRWSLILGVIHLVASGFLSMGWGVLLLAVGGASFLFSDAAMFAVYAVTLAWAGISNALGGEIGWIAFAVFQLFLAFRVFQRFFRYRAAQESVAGVLSADSPLVPDRARRIFPWLGGVLGVLAVVGLVGVFASMFVLIALDAMGESPAWLALGASLVENVAVLAIAVSLASLLSRYRFKGVAIVGLVGGTLVIGIQLLLILT